MQTSSLLKIFTTIYLFLTLFLVQIIAQPDSINYVTFHKIDKAQNVTTGEGVKAAVLDWMFDMSPEASHKYVDAVSLVPGQEIGVYEPWHGEWMAQIIHNIAPGAKIIPVRCRPAGTRDYEKAVEPSYQNYLIEGIRYAADHGASVITNSMGPVKQTDELNDAIEYAAAKGAVFVDVHPEYKRKVNGRFIFCDKSELNQLILHPGIFSVPGHPVNPDSIRDLYTWPYNINPVYKDGWGYSNGPPITAGIIALMKSVNPKLKAEEVKDILISVSSLKNGFKVPDAEAAVRATMNRLK